MPGVVERKPGPPRPSRALRPADLAIDVRDDIE
jgi:hypothetical protein